MAGVILAILAVLLLCVALSFKLHARQPQTPSAKDPKAPLFKSAALQPQQMSERVCFLKHSYLFHFKEEARLDQNCPVSISL